MDSLANPDSLRSHANIEFREERCIDEQDSYDYFAAIDGLAAIGLTNEAGAVLLMNSPHGWRLPYGPVDLDEDWIRVSQRIGRKLTGIDITVSQVERVARITHCLEEDDRDNSISYDIVLRAIPVAGEPIASSPSFGPWDKLELGWFDSVPEDAYWDHGDAVRDIRLFIG